MYYDGEGAKGHAQALSNLGAICANSQSARSKTSSRLCGFARRLRKGMLKQGTPSKRSVIDFAPHLGLHLPPLHRPTAPTAVLRRFRVAAALS